MKTRADSGHGPPVSPLCLACAIMLISVALEEGQGQALVAAHHPRSAFSLLVSQEQQGLSSEEPTVCTHRALVFGLLS